MRTIFTTSTAGWNLKYTALALFVAGSLACAGTTDGGGSNNGGSDSGGDSGGGNSGGDGGNNGGSGNLGGIPPVSECGDLSDARVGTFQLRRLSASQYANAVQDLVNVEMDPLLQFLPDSKTGPFDANTLVPATELDIEKYQDSARDLAARLQPARVRPCNPSGNDDTGCRDDFINEFGLRAYRRPLTDDERTAFQGLFDTVSDEGFDEGVRIVVEAMLQSPNFLYIPEFGESINADNPTALTDYEMATRLSFLIWDSVPDMDLLNAAKDGKLHEDADLEEQVGRMVDDARFANTAKSFGRQWLEIDRIAHVSKNPDTYNYWGTEFQNVIVTETERFLEHVMTEGEGTMGELLLADYTFLDPDELIPRVLYGVNASNIDTNTGRVPLKPEQRSGVLTHLSVLSATAPTLRSAPIYRGILVQENFLCNHLPPPPDDVDFSVPEGADMMTPQELLRQHQDNPTCAPCHEPIDNTGFAFSRYDGVGQYKATKNGEELDETGRLVNSDLDGEDVIGARAMSDALSRSETVKECMAQHWFRYGLGRDPTEDDLCTLAQIKQAGIDSDGEFRAMLVALAKSGSFRLVQGE